jgi:hypothetical protein
MINNKETLQKQLPKDTGIPVLALPLTRMEAIGLVKARFMKIDH